MVTTRAQLHDLIDRIPAYAFEGGANHGTHAPDELIRALRDLTDMTKILFGVARQLAAGDIRLGPPGLT